MASGVKKAFMALAMVMMLAVPTFVEAVDKIHWFECKDCHRAAGLKPWQLMGVCSKCHPNSPTNWPKIQAGSTVKVSTPAPGNFDAIDASNAFGSHPSYNSATAKETSHYWASQTDNMPQAGALPPVNPGFDVTTASKGKVTCSRCHDPHAFETNPKMTKIENSRDQMCKDCHRPWDRSNNDGLETHPMADDYAAMVAAAPEKFNAVYNSTTGLLSTNVNQGAVRVVYNSVSGKFMVSCTSCHGVHFTDSDSTTADGLANRAGLVKGDGKMLRTDGPLKTVTPYNAANSILQAQARSRLCQACHTYQTHGKSGYEPTNDLDSVDEAVGCLVCHSGHSYNGGTPNYFVLRRTVTTASFGPNKTTLYTTNPTSWETYCTSCHGPVSGFPTALRTHNTGENCKGCHAHDAAYSFAMGDNATVCGDCHGAPPRTNTAAVPGNLIIDTGYAVYSGTLNYMTAGQNGKDESRTPHKIHAGALNADKAVVDYAFGSAAAGLVSACLPCHNDQADTVTPTHDTGSGSFQSVDFSSFATYSGVITGQAYPTSGGSAWKCSNIYCHSNGGKRNATGTKVVGDFKTTQTPAWALGSNPGTIVGTGTECQQCHGENIATMAIGAGATQKGNSQTHNRHLTKLGDAKTTCYLCHSDTADATGAVPAAARNIRTGGDHVNGVADVVFNSAVLGGALSGGSYTGGASGTCSVYCHNPSALDTAGGTFDWDNYTGAALACDACHEGLATDAKPISTGSHARHIAATGAKVKCDSCHGAGAALGTHSGHVDGVVTKLTAAASCDVCHGVENTAAWDVTPTWGLSASVDCRTCHVDSTGGGNSVTSYVDSSSVTRQVTTANTLDKSNFNAKGHGKAGVAKVCTECHDSAYSATHMNATTGDNRLQVLSGQNYGVSVNGFCAVCHVATTNTHFDNAQTSGGASVSGTTCNICHNPHGQVGNTMDAMIVNSIGGRTVSGFADRNVRGSYFINPPSVAGYGICQVCHDPNAPDSVQHFNWNTAEPLHQDATNTVKCIQCHRHDNSPGFQKSGDSCESCHAGKMAEPRHARHTNVTPSIEADRSDCAKCHPNAASYTTSGGHADHMNSATTLVAGVTAQGGGNYTCSIACHVSSVTDGYWTDTTGLNCNACHGGANADGHPAGARHDKHLTAGMTCSGCHTGIDVQGPGPLTHNDSESTATDLAKLETRGTAYVNTSGLDAEVDDSTWNAGSGNTFVNGAGTTNNTCSNTDCHDPSNSGTVADFDTSVASCTLCHGYGTTMTSGSHSLHLNNAAVIGDNFACTVCHPDNTVPGTDHTLTGGNIQGVVTVAGSKVNTYGGEVNLPNTAYGTCTASQCHNDGKGANVPSPAWGRAPQSSDNCTICHAAPPANGDHPGHWVAGRQSLGLGCTSCHSGTTATDTTIKSGNLHLNGSSYNVAAGGTYNAVAVTITYTQGTPSNCTASCHSANPKNWAPANTCNGCHSNPPATGAHAKHASATDQTTAEDRTDCAQCHIGADTYTYAAGGNHQNGSVNVAAGWSDNGTPANKNDDRCSSACHLTNGAVDGFWGDSNGLDCAACHYFSASPTSAANSGHAKAISTSSHNKHFDKSKLCTDCHGALENGGASVAGPLTHITASGANQGAILAGKAAAAQDEANVTRTSMTWNDGGNTCSNNGGGLALGCHATGSPVWGTAGPLACVACHTDETTSAVNPTSGLHNFTVATRHDDTLQTGNCTNCHDAASPSNLHQNGTMNNSTAATYTFNANVISYSNANGCQANCHADGGDWRRRWSGAVNAKPGVSNNPGDAVCTNCHGDFTNGWRWNEANATTTDHTDPNDDLTEQTAANHSGCETCHGWGNAAYDKTWTTGKHGDGLITMNGPVGTGSGYDNTTGGCAQSCHGDIATRRLNSNSGWTAAFGNFGGGGCNSCHGYPPVQRLTGAGAAYTYAKVEDYPGGGRAHAVVAHLNPTGLDPTDGWTPCTPCHQQADHNSGLGVGNLLTNRDASATWANEATRYPRVNVSASYDKGGTAFYNMAARNTAAGMGLCNNASCHFGESPKWDCIPADTTNDPQ